MSLLFSKFIKGEAKNDYKFILNLPLDGPSLLLNLFVKVQKLLRPWRCSGLYHKMKLKSTL